MKKSNIPREYRTRVLAKAKALHKDIYSVIFSNMGFDYELYNRAYVTMGDRKLSCSFSKGIKTAECFNLKKDSEIEKLVGDTLVLQPYNKYGFMFRCELLRANKKDIALALTPKIHPNEDHNLTEEDLKDIEDYLDGLLSRVDELKYSPELTHNNINMRYVLKAFARQRIYDEEVLNLPKEEVFIPAVKAAVDWWAIRLCSIFYQGEHGLKGDAGMFADAAFQQAFMKDHPTMAKIEKFRVALGNYITEELSQGNEIRLSTDYAPIGKLDQAIMEAGIDPARAPLKTSMTVGIDNVCVNGKDIYHKDYDLYNYLLAQREENVFRTLREN